MNPTEAEAAHEREKLLRARAEIEEVLTRHELIGAIAMAGKHGRSEALLHVDAPWSKLQLVSFPDGTQGLRLRSQKVDYGGNKGLQRRDLVWTLGALSSIAQLSGMQAIALMETSGALDGAVGATHTPIEPEHKQ